MTRLRLVTAAAALGMAVVGGGCTTARNDLGTTSSQCFRAIPVARAAVRGQGTYSGAVLVSVAALHAQARLRVVAARAGPNVQALCLVAYQGTYRPADVVAPSGPIPKSGKGTYAVAIVSSPGNILLGTGIFKAQPVRFRHLHAGS